MNSLEGRAQWRSTASYVMVMIGAVVGLGNVIQFPYLVTKYGGLFVLFYIFCEILISLPLLFAELFIGRTGKQNPVGSIGILASVSKAGPGWRWLGWLSVLFAFLTLSYYTVQAAFPLGYLISSLQSLTIYGQGQRVPVPVHGDFATNFLPLELCFIVFLLVTIWVIVRGINRGLEMISWVTVPIYSFILVALAIYICAHGGFLPALHVLFSLHEIDTLSEVLGVFFAAMSFALFKLGVGMGIMVVYGSYIPYFTSYGKSTLLIVLIDALTSLVAFFVVYPLLLQSNLNFSQLNNHSVIYLFTAVPHGIVIAGFFFLAAIMVAWTCTISMAETVAVTLIERFRWSRVKASWVVFLGALLVGSLDAMTHTQWMDVALWEKIPVFGAIRSFTGDFIAPIAAFFIAIFAGWMINTRISQEELEFKPRVYRAWLMLVRYIAPLVVLVVAFVNLYFLFFE